MAELHKVEVLSRLPAPEKVGEDFLCGGTLPGIL
jgi:hypothetical protein